MKTYKIIVRKYNNKGKEYLDIAAECHGIPLGAIVEPANRAKGVEMVKNSIAALETYGALIIGKRNASYHPNQPILNWFKKLFRIDIYGFNFPKIDPKKIPKDFDKE